jgi:ppGpp synthetase/RelA/SpoT-type nucleotidyltranferase
VPPSLSRSQIRQLGKRLRVADSFDVGDEKLLQRLITEHEPPMEKVASTVTALARPTAAVASRLKSRESIVEKLRRNPAGPLYAMQDLAGVRVTDSFILREQDDLVRALQRAFADCEVMDRRDNPSVGYRAVHVIAQLDGFNVEIQVRTDFQDFWAQLSEEWFRELGPCIKYGVTQADPPIAHKVAAHLEKLSRLYAETERLLDLIMRLQLTFAAIAARPWETEEEFEEQEDALNSITETLDELQDRAEEVDRELSATLASLVMLSSRND